MYDGSMMGSGIYAQEFEQEMDCPTCEKEVCVLFTTNDWQTSAGGQCPDCGYEFDIEVSNEPDPDEAYDRMRDEW
jgi:transcription elongation factor Elf1